jgi:coproporphyrinogen III oxidase
MKTGSTVLFFTALLFFILTAASPVENLNNEQMNFSGDMEKFIDTMEMKLLSAAERFNGNRVVQTKNYEFDVADYVVKVARGPVIEKAGFMRTEVKKALPPMMPEPLLNRYMQIDVYPKTPLVGMLHIAMNFTYYKNGTNDVGGVMDITPGSIIKEDLDGIKDEMDKLFSELKIDIIPFRKPLLRGHHKEDLKASCVGVSFYKRPALAINEENMNIVKKSIETFFDAYMNVIEKRKDKPYGKNDLKAMFDMRRRWLEKQFFWDPMASTGLYPYEVFSFQDLPPKVTF